MRLEEICFVNKSSLLTAFISQKKASGEVDEICCASELFLRPDMRGISGRDESVLQVLHKIQNCRETSQESISDSMIISRFA